MSILDSGPTHPPYLMGNGGFFPRIKQPTNAVDHLPPPSAKVKNVWTYTSTSPQISPWHGHRQFTFDFSSVQTVTFDFSSVQTVTTDLKIRQAMYI